MHKCSYNNTSKYYYEYLNINLDIKLIEMANFISKSTFCGIQQNLIKIDKIPSASILVTLKECQLKIMIKYNQGYIYDDKCACR